MNQTDLANTIAREIFKVGSDPHDKAHRIEFKGGAYPNDETSLGGFCESALATHILSTLRNAT